MTERTYTMDEWASAWRKQCEKAEAEVARLREENERLKVGLRRIADANSGEWGWIAHDTLHPDRARTKGS